MDSTTAGSGDELVATLEARELWMDVNLQTLIAPIIPTFPMPSNPFDIPRQLGDVNFYPGTENISTTSTALGTGKTTLTAYELVGQVPYSFSLEEDGVIAMLPEIRAGLVRNVAEVLDDIILNGDASATNNINADGATISSSEASGLAICMFCAMVASKSSGSWKTMLIWARREQRLTWRISCPSSVMRPALGS